MLNDDPCEECREERKEYIPSEEHPDEIKCYSDIVVGFGSQSLDRVGKGVDVLLVLESYGGGIEWNWHDLDWKERWERFNRGERTIKECSRDLKEYYLETKIDRYHQKCVREVIEGIRNSGSYFVSDLIKCYVSKKNSTNFRRACKFCGRNILKNQIDYLQPKVIVSFGGHARDFFNKEYLNKPSKEPKLKEIKEFSVEKPRTDSFGVIVSPFPSARNADLFVRAGDSEGLTKKIMSQL